MAEKSESPKSIADILSDISVGPKTKHSIKSTTSKKFDFSQDYINLIKSLEQETSLEELEVVKQGLVLLALAMRTKKQGLNLAVVDNKGNIVANIDGY
jgi:hypothetical protein